MISHLYEVICDSCNTAIKHYFERPSRRQLTKDKICIISAKPFRHLCDVCAEEGRNRYLEIIGKK